MVFANEFRIFFLQRCRERLREKRRELFNSRRVGISDADKEEIQDTLTQIVRKEFSDLTIMNVDESGDSLDFNREPLTEEEAFAIEKEILAEEGKKNLYKIWFNYSQQIRCMSTLCEKPHRNFNA